MPAPKNAASNAARASKAKTASSSGTATPISAVDKDTLDPAAIATLAAGKPDKKAFDVQQDHYKKEIDALQASLSAVRDKLSLAAGNSGPGNERRNELRAELEAIRGQQSQSKVSRSKLIEQKKALNDNIHKKIKDLQVAKAKIPFKTVAEVESHIAHLERQVESGSMKLAEEKRALAEISSTRRSLRLVESFQVDQASIEADRALVEELNTQIEDPVAKADSERYDVIKEELDELKKLGDELAAGRNKLFRERDEIQAALNELFEAKRAAMQQYRDDNDRHWKKLNDDRQRRAERAREQRAAEEKAKKKEIADHLLEEAQSPAFQFFIEDCQTLIDLLSGTSTSNTTFKSTDAQEKVALSGVPKLEPRKVEDIPEGSVVRKKKGEEEESYFVGGKNKSKAKKNTHKIETPTTPATPSTATSPSGSLQLALPTLSALLSLSIPPPTSSSDVPRVIEDLRTKKAWYEANQDRVTSENIAKAEARIRKLNEDGTLLEKAETPEAEEVPAAESKDEA